MYKLCLGGEYTQEGATQDSWVDGDERTGLGSCLGTVHEDWPFPSMH